MKRLSILLTIVLLVVGTSVFAEESVLIDFATLLPDMDDGINNEATVVDFSAKAGTSFSDDEKARMKTSLAIEQWEVVLANSSQTVVNTANSYTRMAPVSQNAKKYAGETVLGVRIHFPVESYNSFAVVQPPFEIPAYMKRTVLDGDTLTEDETDYAGSKYDGYGVVKNVGVIKSIRMNVYGNNFPNGLGLILKDQNNNVSNIFMDYLEFDGWGTLQWDNPNYVTEVRNREIKKYPLYPKSTPMYKLLGIIVYKDSMQEGGDFIGYIKDISVTYDKAILNLERDINDEALWGILGDREESRRNAEFSKLGNLQVLRYLEQLKMHQDGEAAEEDAAAPAAE